MKETLIRTSTYPRWISDTSQTLIGISRYSLVSLAKSDDSFSYNILREHMRKQYVQISILLLAQRASILHFSKQVSDISEKIKNIPYKKPEDFEQVTQRVRKLHAEYISFQNRIWFTEITPQEQGIEMYNQATACMELKRDMAELQNEIHDLYEFINLSNSSIESQQIKTLTFLGAVFLPFSAAISLFAILQNSTIKVQNIVQFLLSILGVFIFILIFWFAYFAMKWFIKKSNNTSLSQSLDQISLKGLCNLCTDFFNLKRIYQGFKQCIKFRLK